MENFVTEIVSIIGSGLDGFIAALGGAFALQFLTKKNHLKG